MKERDNVFLFYLSVILLVVTTVMHEFLDPPDSLPDWISNIAFVSAVGFLLVMTLFVFRPQIKRIAANIALMNTTMSQLNLLKTVATAANEAESTKEGLQIAVDTICEYTGWPVGHVCMFSKEHNALISSGVWHIRNPKQCADFKIASEALLLEPHQGFIGEVYTDSTPMWIMNVADSGVHTRKEPAIASGLKAAFAFPIFVGRKAVAVMEFYSYTSAIPDESLLSVMANIGKQLGQTIEREHTLKKLKRANMKAEAAARDLQDSLLKAEEANKAKSDFLANMSHELRTPMNGVLGMAQLLANTSLDSEQKELVSTINSSGEGLLMLLNDILDFSKIEAGALVLENIPYNPKEVMQQTVQLLTMNVGKKGIELFLEIDDDIPTHIMGDSGRMRQIITNLVGNSIKFTHQGYVRLSARLTEPNHDHLHIRVEDTGIGIPQDKLGSIFEKFTQADASVTRKYGGTGLGLAITQQLVTMMGGEMGVESQEGMGSVFWFNIPCIEANYCEINAHKPAMEAMTISHKRIPIAEAKALLVEDYHVNQVFAQKLLKKYGFEHIDLAESGTEALKKYHAQDYDVIFMDCQMPEMDGYQATIKIREIEQDTLMHIPIIAMTANAMMGDREKCLKAGMDDYVSKPLRAQHLQTILQNLFILNDDSAGLAIGKTEVVTPGYEDPPVDMEQLRIFTDGDPEEERVLAQLFFEQAQEMITILEQSISADKCEAWKSAAHRFKGSSGNFGAMKLHNLCKHAESHYEGEEPKKIKMLDAIKEAIIKVKEFMGNASI
ncbi:MAG: ATP-binding protein [Rickettsiales bacterium]|nr:ATP-binding protein [Rickettsiales bacterium]